VDLNGKDPLLDESASGLRASERSRSTERRRVRRRARVENRTQAKIRIRVWLACAGALLVMALVIYYALGREPVSEQGAVPGVGAGTVSAVSAPSGLTPASTPTSAG
jgi:hypothetical protein